jgi:hypothetical protein
VDPNGQGNRSVTAGPGGDLDPSNPVFQAADEACRPSLGPGGEQTRTQTAGGGAP